MASLRIKPGANHSIFHSNKSHQFTHSNSSVFLPNPSKKIRTQKGVVYVSSSMAALSSSPSSTKTPVVKQPSLLREEVSSSSPIGQPKDTMVSSRLDEWMEESAQEIVKSLKQAPLLVHIYDEYSNNGKAKFKTEKAVLENWRIVNGEWESGEIKSPDGLIFVEELQAVDESSKKDFVSGDGDDFEEGVTRAWGIVVQGKGVECGPACYLLKTSRVGAGLGLGMCCTHFCLTRVQSFTQSALRQFEDSWLLR